MSGEYDAALIKDSTERKGEILLAERKGKRESQASTSQAKTEVITNESEDKKLVDALDAIKIDIMNRAEEKQKIKIQEIPRIMLRNGNLKEDLKPTQLSIGPIHAADSDLYNKELKLKLAASFIEKINSTGALLLEKIKSEIKDIKAYFAEEVIKSYTDEELLRLVFLDGCAMLGFIHSYVNNKLSIFSISNGQAVLIQQDLFLLENQIPFIVLNVLLHVNESEITGNLIADLIKFTISSSSIIVSKSPHGEDIVEFTSRKLFSSRSMPDHIFDLQLRVLSGSDDEVLSLECPCPTSAKCWCCLFCCVCSCGVCNIVYALRALISWVVEYLNKSYDLPEQWSNMQSFRSVRELKAAGIKFKPTDSLKTISFCSRFMIRGELSLPTLVVDSSTERMLLNLVAYEMCRSSDHYVITSYVNFLDLLVDNERDVKDLRVAGIIRNCLSSDNEVAQLINSIGSNCSLPPSDNFAHVKYNIDKHYKRRCAIWIAQVVHAHFRSPLTVLALVAATMILALTAVQTWYAVNPKK
ncbi:hypothetical protein TIFTF001_021225 [Ficus carica]|uniref:Uncharacterized protein n=1 Tax=Ficus carica TaxID=3494 RepID=A0AA88DED2_FICCA|nr:hypothetical protein TIFTF001_021225 [Ficus carica]